MNDPQERNLQIASFRYRLIADAAETDGAGVDRAIEQASKRVYPHPDGGQVSYSERTLYRWLRAYRRGGLRALGPKRRKDAGQNKAISEKLLQQAVMLRKQNPNRATKTLIDILQRQKLAQPGQLKQSTLDRQLSFLGASRRMLHSAGEKVFQKILTTRPLELLIADFHHGPYVRVGDDERARRALLLCFIDHYSRYVPEGRYYLHEDFAALRFGFRRVLLSFGVCHRLYVDNGPSFQSHRFEAACKNQHLDIQLVHSKPYCAEGRGCCERFNRTVKEQFESEAKGREELLTLDELNAYFEAWLAERYHQQIHSETDEAPFDRFYNNLIVREAPDLQLLDELFRLRKSAKVHPKWCTVEVQGTRYLVDSALRGHKVQVLYDGFDKSYVLIEYQGRVMQRAYPQRPGQIPEQVHKAEKAQAGTDYLLLLRENYETRTRAELSALKLVAADSKKELSCTELQSLLLNCRCAPLTDAERVLIQAFFRKLRPMLPEPTKKALDSARRRLGTGLHLSVYLQALQASVICERKKGEKPQ